MHAALTCFKHRPPVQRVIQQAGAVAQEGGVDEARVVQLGRGQVPGLIRQECQGLVARPTVHHIDAGST